MKLSSPHNCKFLAKAFQKMGKLTYEKLCNFFEAYLLGRMLFTSKFVQLLAYCLQLMQQVKDLSLP